MMLILSPSMIQAWVAAGCPTWQWEYDTDQEYISSGDDYVYEAEYYPGS